MFEPGGSELICKLQKAQKIILLELDRVCKLLDLSYCLAYGSALGAMRHRGFIPWDDDIDVYMRIEDLEVLQCNTNLFAKDFFLQHHESDSQFGLMISRLRNSNTTLIEKSEVQRDINHGIFIDIYPLFNSPKDGWGAKKLLIASMLYRLMLYDVVPKNRGMLMKYGSLLLLKMIPKSGQRKIIERSFKIMKNCPKTGYVSSLYGDDDNIRYPEDWLFPVKWVRFDDIMVPIGANADEYLRCIYGDYMQLPPIEQRTFHHSYACIDFDRPYTEYKGCEYCKE